VTPNANFLPGREVDNYQLKTKEVGRALPDRIVLTYLEKRWAMPTLQPLSLAAIKKASVKNTGLSRIIYLTTI